MTAVALLTPTYRRDLELCRLLCESVDRHVTSFSKHYLLVPDDDLALFAPLANAHRLVIPASGFLPGWLRPLPPILRRKRRQFWWSLRTRPISGWHVQQLLKIAATLVLPDRRYCILDSDVVFFRDFDLARFAYPSRIPLLNMPNAVTPAMPRHAAWIVTTHQILGYPTPSLPASDFIGHIIFWDQHTVQALTARIEHVTGRGWIEALCRIRNFSEYMLYGYFVENDLCEGTRHTAVATTPCLSYWEGSTLDQAALGRLLQRAGPGDVAFSVASFSGTPVETIRAAVAAHQDLRIKAGGVLADVTAPC